MELIAASEADCDRLLELVAAYRDFEGQRFHAAETRAALLALLRDPALGRIWLIHEAGRAVGYVALAFGFSLEYLGRDAIVDEFFLDAAYRGRGLGSAVLAAVEAEAAALGVRALHLEVRSTNPGARRLYERSGFEAHDSAFMTKWTAPAGG